MDSCNKLGVCFLSYLIYRDSTPDVVYTGGVYFLNIRQIRYYKTTSIAWSTRYEYQLAFTINSPLRPCLIYISREWSG